MAAAKKRSLLRPALVVDTYETLSNLFWRLSISMDKKKHNEHWVNSKHRDQNIQRERERANMHCQGKSCARSISHGF
jgi:hypothetical protein